MKKGLLVLLSALLAFSFALTGCGSKETTQPSDQKTTESSGAVTQAPAAGGTFVFGRGGDSVALDPAIVTDGESLKVTKNIFDTLIDYEDTSTKIQPALATEWKISDDGLTYTFTLRDGVTFHDGTPFNAEAVVFNFERWMDPKHEFHTGGDFEYYAAMFSGYKGDEGHVIKEVKAVDEHTVQFTLNRPQGPFLQNLAMSPFGIASPTAVKKFGDKFLENPVGTGPFVFQEWKRKDSITLVKNPNFWMEGYPKLDKVIFKSIPDNTARFTALQSGEIDAMDGMNPDDADIVKSSSDFQLILRPSMNVGYLGFNVNQEPLNNPKVRVALSHAVNKEGLISAFYNGMAEPAKNPMPPSIWGYNDNIQDYPYDLEKAKQLLAEAGYPDGFKVEFWAMPVPRPYMPDGKKIAEAIAADLRKIGVETEIITMDWAQYLEQTKQGKQGIFLLGWTGDNGDPDNFIYVLLDKDNIGGSNRSFYGDEELHEILIKAQSLTDQAERTKLYEQAQEIIHRDAPWVPLVHSTPALAAKNTVKNYVAHPTGSDKLTKVEIAQ